MGHSDHVTSGDPGNAGKSILIFDDGLRSVEGHFYEYDLAVAKLHRDIGTRVTLICHEQFKLRDRFEAMGVEVLPILRQSIWVDFQPWPGRFREIPGIVKRSLYFARILRRHLAKRSYDVAFLPNAMISDVLAWRLVRLGGVAGRVKRLVMLFRFSLRFHPISTGGEQDLAEPERSRFLLWRLIFASHRPAIAEGKVALVTDSLRLARQYGQALDIDLQVVPSPRTLPERTVGGLDKSLRPMTFAMVGHARWARGIDLFCEAISLLIESGRAANLRFIMQWHAEVRRPDWSLYELNPVLQASDQVTIIDRTLSSDEYDRVFDRIDCIVLPYRREHYFAQISGVAIEAACAGIPMIVTQDCWLSDYLADQGAGLTVPEGDVARLADAMAKLAAARERFAEEARQKGALARARNAPEEFLRVLLGAKGPAPVQPSHGLKSSR